MLDWKNVDWKAAREEILKLREERARRQRAIEVEIADLNQESEDIMREVAGIDQILKGLDVMESNTVLEPPGMTEHIRRVLQQTTIPLFPTQIRDSLKAVGIKGSSDKNLLISVHTVLSRLKADLVESEQDGKTAYKWNRRTIDQRIER